MQAKIDKYSYILKTSISEGLVYVVDFLGRVFFFGFIITIYLLLWQSIFADQSGRIDGFTLNHMIWYLIITEIITLSGTNYYKEVSQDVKTGNIAYLMNKPYHYVIYSFFNNMGKMLVNAVTIAFFGVVLGLVLVGPLEEFKLIAIPFVIISVVLGIILDYFINFTLALTAFWVEENMPFRWIYQKLVFTLGGMLIPLDLFPRVIAKFSKKLPFAYVTYGPAKLLVNFDFDLLVNIMVGQFIYLTIAMTICFMTYKKGVKGLNVNGG